MKKIFTMLFVVCILLLLSGNAIANAPRLPVRINQYSFTDPVFRNWVKYNIANGNDILTEDMVKSTTKIEVASKEIKSLKGIEFFSDLITLDCNYNEITDLDISNNKMLEDLNCSLNFITTLDVSQNVNLKKLNCAANEIRVLDVTKNTELIYFSCSNNNLNELDVTNNKSLVELYCYNNNLISLDTSNNTSLSTVYLNGQVHRVKMLDNGEPYIIKLEDIDPNIDTLNISGVKGDGVSLDKDSASFIINAPINKFKYNYITNNNKDDYERREMAVEIQLVHQDDLQTVENKETLDFSDVIIDKNTFPDQNFRKWVIENITEGNGVLTADMAKKVKEINVEFQHIESLKGIEYFINLEKLYCEYNKLISLDVSNNINLKVLACYYNGLTELDLTNNKKLEEVSCYSNQLRNLDISNNKRLRILVCFDNKLSMLDTSNNRRLEFPDTQFGDQTTSLSITGVEPYVIQLDDIDPNMDQGWINRVEGATWNLENGNFTNFKIDEGFTYYYGSLKVNMRLKLKGDFIIDENSFPDPLFRMWLVENIAKGGNNLTEDEINAVESIEIESTIITNLKGVEYFTNLKKLYVFNGEITELDVSKNTKLVELDCEDNNLKKLDISNNKEIVDLNCSINNLTELNFKNNEKLETLYCNSNNLKKLDISYNKELQELYCRNNKLIELDISKNTNITTLDCSNNKLTKLDISKNNKLYELLARDQETEIIYISEPNIIKLEDIDPDIDPAMIGDVFGAKFDLENSCFTDFVLGENITYEYDFSDYNVVNDAGNQRMTVEIKLVSTDKLTGGYVNSLVEEPLETDNDELVIMYNNISVEEHNESDAVFEDVIIDENSFPDPVFRLWVVKNIAIGGRLDKENAKNVINLDVSEMNINSLKGIEYFYNLVNLDCRSNNIYELDISKNTKLKELNCYFNDLSYLDVSKNINLEKLDCERNRLNQLDVSKNINLKILDCYDNNISELNVSKNTKLVELDCESNKLMNLDVTKNTMLERLDCSRTEITELDVSKNTKLVELDCEGNKLTNLDVTKNIKLEKLNCSNNKIETLDCSNNIELQTLNCSVNELLTLNILNNKKLETLECNNNKLNSLDISNNKELYKLNCSENSLTQLETINNPQLEYIICFNNKLTELDISNNKELFSLNCNINNLKELDISNNFNLHSLSCNNNKLIKLNIDNNDWLRELNCSENKLTNLDVYKNNSLEKVDAIMQSPEVIVANDGGPYTLSIFDVDPYINASRISPYVYGAIWDAEKNSFINFKPGQSIKYYYDIGKFGSMDVELRLVISDNTVIDENIDLAPAFNDVVIDENSFPDTVFRAWVIENIAQGNAVLDKEMVKNTTNINVSKKGIGSLKGIEHFSYLQKLYCDGNNLSMLDVTSNTILILLKCSENTINSLDVSNNEKLMILDCGKNNLTTLDLSKNTKLEQLYCGFNNLYQLNILNNKNLKRLYCGSNNLSLLDVTKNINLDYLGCDINKLSELYIDNNTKLTIIKCNENSLGTLDVTKNIGLTVLDCGNNNLKLLDVSRNIDLEQLFCGNNNLLELNILNNLKLKNMYCGGNKIRKLDISNNNLLEVLGCNENNLSSLNVIYNTNLKLINAVGQVCEISLDEKTDKFKAGDIDPDIDPLNINVIEGAIFDLESVSFSGFTLGKSIKYKYYIKDTDYMDVELKLVVKSGSTLGEAMSTEYEVPVEENIELDTVTEDNVDSENNTVLLVEDDHGTPSVEVETAEDNNTFLLIEDELENNAFVLIEDD